MARLVYRYKTLAGAQRRARFENALSKTHFYTPERNAEGVWQLRKTPKPRR